MGCHMHEKYFKGGACNSCHGFPPEPTGAKAPPLQNYAGGGGPHLEHVNFIASKTGITVPVSQDDSPEVLCAPCHGTGAGSTNHMAASAGGAWADGIRQQVDIAVRTDYSSWSTTQTPTYGGGSRTLPVKAASSATAMTNDNSRCGNIDCHGTLDTRTEDSAVKVSWYLANDTTTDDSPSDPEDGLERSKVCQACHDENPADLRVYNEAGSVVHDNTSYISKGVNAAAVYFGTPSGYGRGGHGDPGISSVPTGHEYEVVQSSSNTAPIDCTACHAATSTETQGDHFPADSVNNPNRLKTGYRSGSDIQNMCDGCHPNYYQKVGSYYLHHPSYVGKSSGDENQIIPGPATGAGAGSMSVRLHHWAVLGGALTRSNSTDSNRAYGAGGTVNSTTFWRTDVDRFINWWEFGAVLPTPPSSYGVSTKTTTPIPVFYGESLSESPKVTLPLEMHITQGGSSIPHSLHHMPQPARCGSVHIRPHRRPRRCGHPGQLHAAASLRGQHTLQRVSRLATMDGPARPRGRTSRGRSAASWGILKKQSPTPSPGQGRGPKWLDISAPGGCPG